MSNLLHTMNPIDTLDSMKDVYFAPYITLAHLFNAPPVWGIKWRMLTQYQFQYVVDGMAEYQIEGNTYITKRGDLIYHVPGQFHSVKTITDEPYVCISIVFHFGASPFPLQELIGKENDLGNFKDHPIEAKLSQLITYYHQPGQANHVHCQGLFMQIIAELARWKQESTSQTKVQEKTKAKLILIRNYLTKYYDQEIKHNDLENISGLSRNYLIIKFKETFGMTPFEFLTWVRIERAKELAIQTNLPIGEIAQSVGYADVHTFGRMFKNKTGGSLSQFCATLVTD